MRGREIFSQKKKTNDVILKDFRYLNIKFCPSNGMLVSGDSQSLRNREIIMNNHDLSEFKSRQDFVEMNENDFRSIRSVQALIDREVPVA
jgi:hypothetical protein